MIILKTLWEWVQVADSDSKKLARFGFFTLIVGLLVGLLALLFIVTLPLSLLAVSYFLVIRFLSLILKDG